MSRKKHRNKKLNSVSRRQFLSMLGVGGLYYAQVDPVRTLLRAVVDGMINQAQAATTGTPVKNYVAVILPNAPLRWVWDSSLQPNGNDPFTRNAGLSNRLTVNRYGATNTNATFASVDTGLLNYDRKSKLYMPPLWNENIPTFNGGWAKMSTLLNNALIMRGVHMRIDKGHLFGPGVFIRPNPVEPGLTGLVADASTAKIPAVGLSSRGTRNYGDPRLQAFKAKTSGLEAILVPNCYENADPIGQILGSAKYAAAIGGSTSAAAQKKREIETLSRAALDELGQYVQNRKPGAETLYKNRASAEGLIDRLLKPTANDGLSDFSAEFSVIIRRYLEIANRCAEPIDFIIPPTGAAPYVLNRPGHVLAEQFAVAEYLIKKRISTSITIVCDSGNAVNGLKNDSDEHGDSGQDVNREKSIICHSYQFRVLSAMIAEFSRSLGTDLWGQTVVHVSAEFDRAPRADFLGSDHAHESNVMSVFSGAIKQPTLVGNVKINSRPNDSNKSGTIGGAGEVESNDKSRKSIIYNEDAAATVAGLLGVEAPVRATPIVTFDQNGTMSVNVETPKNVA